MHLSKIKSCNIELQSSKKILFTGSGSLQYYYTAEGKIDSFEHYDIEMESKEGFNSTLIMYDEKTTKLHVTGEAESLKQSVHSPPQKKTQQTSPHKEDKKTVQVRQEEV